MLMMDGQLDVHWMGLLEQKLEKTRFVRVDSDTVEHLIEKEEKSTVELTDKEKENLTEAVKSLVPPIAKTEFNVDFKSLGEAGRPIQITQNEFSRRMKEMSAMQPGMAFYGEMPDMYQMVVNMDHPMMRQLKQEIGEKSKEEAAAFAAGDSKLKQVVDLALLANGMLKGEALNNFIKRSVELL